jgi:hypothetical protein
MPELYFRHTRKRGRGVKSEQCVLKILKPNKSLGEDGIISEFYITHWEQIKDKFFLLVNDTFEEKELTPSQYKGVLTLLHKSGEREDIRNWRPLTLLNSDYKIIAKILAERLRVVFPKLIHSDHKGFVKGRNISEANHQKLFHPLRVIYLVSKFLKHTAHSLIFYVVL